MKKILSVILMLVLLATTVISVYATETNAYLVRVSISGIENVNDVELTIRNQATEEKIKVMLSDEDAFATRINLEQGMYDVLEIKPNNDDYVITPAEDTFRVDNTVTSVTITVNETKLSFVQVFLKNNAVLCVLLASSLAVLGIIRLKKEQQFSNQNENDNSAM